MKLLVTGGAGFIGSAVLRAALARGHDVVNLDGLTYAANPATLELFDGQPGYSFVEADIRDADAVERAVSDAQPDAVMHLAAESHVDRSISGPAVFAQTNVLGTLNLLQSARNHHARLDGEARDAFRFHHVSTDEVYGDLGPDDPAFTEDTPYAPSSPYSASKAASDHFVRAWQRTYRLPTLITNCSNNYGPFQFPEKLIPVVIGRAKAGEPIPVYGDGQNVRDWLHVDDHADALLHVLEHGRVGRTYNIGGRAERTNLELVEAICDRMDARLGPLPGGEPRRSLISFVADRAGHDRRYAIDDTRLSTELGWSPSRSLEAGLDETIAWYLDNEAWLSRAGA